MKRYLFLFLLLSIQSFAQDKVQVMTTVTGSRDIPAEFHELEQLINRTLVRITNLTNNPITIVVEGSMTAPDLVARTVRSSINETHYITLGPRATEVFTGDRIRNTFSVSNVEFFIPSENRIVPLEYFYSFSDGSGGLPEGNYDFCFKAFEVNPNMQRPDYSRPIHSTAGSCVSIIGRRFDPPLLQSLNQVAGIYTHVGPFELRPNPDGSLRMQWQAPSGITPGTPVQYQILMAELLPEDTRDPNQVIQAIDIPSEPFAFYRENITDAGRVVTHILPLAALASPFQSGRTYAVRIRAQSTDPNRPLPIQNQGRSPVYAFRFQGSTAGPLELQAYPPNSSYMPFRGAPIVIKYSPYNDAFRRFESQFSIQNTVAGRNNHSRNLSWSPNPLEAQRNATGDPTLDQTRAQHIAISPSASDAGYTFYNYLQRGESYRWNADIHITEGSHVHRQSIAGEFKAGMDKPQLIVPENRTTVDTGRVALKFKTSNAPSMSTLTPFDILQASRRSGSGSFDISIKEKGIIEVAKTPSFSTVIHHEEINLNRTFLSSSTSNEPVSWSEVVAEVYKEAEAAVTIRDTGTYYWRVRWLTDPDAAWNSVSYNESETWQFRVAAREPERAVAERTPCGSPCEVRYAFTSDAAQDLSVGETVYFGQFKVEILEITQRSEDLTFAGRGVITNFGFIVDRVLIEFKALKLKNSAEGKRVAEGSGKAIGGGSLAGNIMHLTALGSIGPEGVRSGSSAPTLTVPFGWDQSIDGHKITALLDSIGLSPTQARAKFRAGYEMPGEFAGHPLDLGAEICIAPGGFREDFDLMLERDLAIGSSADDAYQLLIKGRAAGANATKFSWDCRGFKSLTLGLEVQFSRDALLPENASTGKVDSTGRVSGIMTLRLARDAGRDTWEFIGAVNFPKPFQFTCLPGWGFQVQDAVFDFSDTKNASGMRFPSNYDVSLLGEGEVNDRLKNTWQGFYLKNIRVSLPKELTETETRMSFNVQDFLIDRTGFTGFIGAYNIASASDDGWKISVDTVRLGIVQTRSLSGFIAGGISAPFFKDDSRMNYRSLLNIGFSGKVEYQFMINVPSNKPLKMKLWQAAMKLEKSSYLKLDLSTESKARIQGKFDGTIGIDSSEIGNVPALSLSGIKFENFAFDTEDPRFFKFSRVNRTETGGQMVFAFASPQHSAAGFPLNITDIRLSMSQEGGNFLPTLGFTTELTLSDIGFKAKFGLDIVGEMQISPFNFRVRDAVVKEVGIDVNYNGFQLGGELTFYNADATYGEGIKGKITVSLPMGISGKLEARFGTVGQVTNPSSYYDYWYVDGLIKINPGITIFSGFAIYGFGGGAYYNMKLEAPPRPENAQSTQTAPSSLTGGAASGLKYLPNKGSFGIMATVILGTQPNADVFNMDVTLQAQFNTRTCGLEMLRFEGNGYVMTQMSNRSGEPPVKAKVVIGYYNTDGREFVQGSFQVHVNVYNVLRGAGPENKFIDAELYADMKSDQWWFYIGKDRPLEARGGIILDLPGIAIDARSYIMVGHGIPADLPPLPEEIRQILYAGAQLENQLSDAQVNKLRSTGTMQNGQGFAFGVHFKSEFELNFLMFYAKMGIALGFDANISQNFSRICAESGNSPGINGWYAQGQAYAALSGEMGVKVDLFFIKGEFKFIELKAAIAMQAKLPNPNYFQGRAALQYNILNGMVHGRCNFNIELGEQCTPVSTDPLQGLSFISEMNETDPGSVFTDIQTAFNFGMNEVLELEESSSGETVIRRFMPFVHRYQVKKGSTLQTGTRWDISERGYLSTLTKNEAYDPYTEYKAEVEVRCYELFPNGTRSIMMKDGGIGKEIREYTFTTGARPSTINQVLASYPLIGQKHFMPGESKNPALGTFTNKGYIKIKQQDYLFENSTTTLGPYIYTHVVQFTPSEGGEGIEVPITYQPSQDLIVFDLPTLELNKSYKLSVVTKSSPNPAYPRAQSQVVQRSTRQVRMDEVRILEADNHTVSTIRNEVNIENRSLSRGNSNSRQTQLYQYSFKTSKYATFKEKMSTMQLSDATYRNGIKTLSAQWAENWDEWDNQILLHIRSGNYRSNAQLEALHAFYQAFNSHRPSITKDHVLPSNLRIDKAHVLNPSAYVTLLINRNKTAQSFARMAGPEASIPKATYSLSGNFAEPHSYTKQVPSALSRQTYTLHDSFDWHAHLDMDRLKRQLITFAQLSLTRVTLSSSPAYTGVFETIDGSKRAQLIRLGTQEYPMPQSKYRYTVEFVYRIPLPVGNPVETSVHPWEYSIK